MNRKEKISVDFTSMSRDDMQKMIMELMDKNAELEAKLNGYLAALRLQRSRMFGKSSETSDSLQITMESLNFFNEAEMESDDTLPEPELKNVAGTRSLDKGGKSGKKARGSKKRLTGGLSVRRIEYTLDENDSVCEKCGTPLRHMKKIVRKELTVIPARIHVTEHIQHVYVCPGCSKNGIEANIVKADAPISLLRNSLASPSMIAWTIHRKFVEAVPLYRQEQQFARDGIALVRQTMANWQIRTAELYLESLYNLMRRHLVAQTAIHADETVLEVLHEPGRQASSNSYMWIYCTLQRETPLVLFEYSQSRGHEVPLEFLRGFSGYLTSDGHSAYGTLASKNPSIVNVNCWAHARRKFTDILKSAPKDADLSGSETVKAVGMIDRMFELERKISGLDYEKRLEIRSEKALPMVDAYFEWAKSTIGKTSPGLPPGKAINYSLSREVELRRYLLDGRLEMSNNIAERYAKKFVIGRKNWLFNNTPRGARSSAIIYSIVETAIMNSLDPFRYLEYILGRMAGRAFLDDSEIETYLPWSESLPDIVKSNTAQKQAEDSD